MAERTLKERLRNAELAAKSAYTPEPLRKSFRSYARDLRRRLRRREKALR